VIQIHTFSGGGFGENGYLVVFGESGPGVVIDPGAAATSTANRVRADGISLEAILLTHAHYDHVEGIPAIREVAPEAPVYLHKDDRRLYEGIGAQARAFGLPRLDPLPPPDRELVHGEDLTFGGYEFQVLFAPGHAPGHVIFYLKDEGVAFVGDVVFQGAIGRADLVGGDFHQLMESIHSRVLSLPDETRLLTGHGPETTVGWERRTNPFLVGHFGGELA
jgi:glyoxylase-like metal-dependent hydrolase (beta-lactamase superfamily II)